MPNDMTTGLTRRGFLLGAAATGALATMAGGMTGCSDWLTEAAAEEELDERTAVTYHQCHCGGHCSLQCTVRDGRLCKIEPNEAWEDEQYATVCLKGLSEVQHVYSKDRIQSPMKRVDGELVAISWDEAYDLLIENVCGIQDKYGKNAVYARVAADASSYGGTGMFDWIPSLFQCQYGGFEGIDIGIGNGYEPAYGGSGFGLAYSCNEPRDWVNSKTIILLGSNYLESDMVQSVHFFNAKEAGAEIIVVDPAFSTTASKASKWVPINPGTDAALLLGMIAAIFDHGWINEEFAIDHTTLPFLVDVNTGELLKTEEANSDDPDQPIITYYVWDSAKNAPVPHTDNPAKPNLEGYFTYQGKQYATVCTLARENAQTASVKWASEKTGVDEETIVDLAMRYAVNTPASLGWGVGGGDKYANADIIGHAGALITALTGNFGKPGASTGFFGDGGIRPDCGALLAPWELPEDIAPCEDEMSGYDYPKNPNNVHAAIFVGNIPDQHFANRNQTNAWLQTLDYIVYIDMHNSGVSEIADLVLPACTKFEADEDIQGVKTSYHHILIREKVLDPLFESKTAFTMQKEIAERLGFAEYLPESATELARFSIEQSDDPLIAGLTLDKLKENGGVWPHLGADTIHRSLTDLDFPTPSGRYEVYYEDMADFGQQLPVYEDPNEAFPESEQAKSYPLQFSQPRTRFHLHNQFCDATWIQQYYMPYIELNPADMESRNLSTGDTVKAFNDRGSFACEAKANSSVRPGTARMYEGMWSKYMSEGNVQDVTNDFMHERGYAMFSGPVIPFNDTMIEVERA